MKFREAPRGEVDLAREGVQALRRVPAPGVRANTVCKMALSEEPVQQFPGRGRWFELRVDDFMTGNMSLMAVGFTATDPGTLCGEGDDHVGALPTRANMLEKSYVVGYTGCIYWDGTRLDFPEVFSKVVPLKVFRIGLLATTEGSLEIYIDRKLIKTVDPAEAGVASLGDGPLWAVLDFTSGVKKATLEPMSKPPTGDEEAEAAQAAEAAAE
eukprot:TRINITY_DN71614_c0_g1_i1.p1 TRINITY_DN71614_c0_g1~~TRINITY_DN71614_c0_g1_i1.p1  ORF type:complete len:212 (+),score=48.95 TRINITY_DN71614_c0_g1_i1:131-766(+)